MTTRNSTTTTARRALGIAVGIAATATTMLVGAPSATAAEGSSATVAAEWDCEGTVTAESTAHAISNIVIHHDGGTTKIEAPFEGTEQFDYEFAADDYPGLDAVTIKAGRNGPSGRGETVALAEPTCVVDADGDGHTNDVDCNDADATVYPGAPETPNDGIDQDCDGSDLVVGFGDIRVTLQWTSDPAETVDMDLRVTDPNGETIYWADRTSASGGVLDRDDDVCGATNDGQSIENVFWADGTAPAGTYTVNVDEWSRCAGNTSAASWTVSVYFQNTLITSLSGVGDSDPALYSGGPENTFTFDYPG
jgi:hypothetical protein